MKLITIGILVGMILGLLFGYTQKQQMYYAVYNILEKEGIMIKNANK